MYYLQYYLTLFPNNDITNVKQLCKDKVKMLCWSYKSLSNGSSRKTLFVLIGNIIVAKPFCFLVQSYVKL